MVSLLGRSKPAHDQQRAASRLMVEIAGPRQPAPRRTYYPRRFWSQTPLISKSAIIHTVATKMRAANIANIVSTFAVPPSRSAPKRVRFVPGPIKIQNRPPWSAASRQSAEPPPSAISSSNTARSEWLLVGDPRAGSPEAGEAAARRLRRNMRSKGRLALMLSGPSCFQKPVALLVNCESDQAREKQNKPGYGHREETTR
jgi:hypothetical protein